MRLNADGTGSDFPTQAPLHGSLTNDQTGRRTRRACAQRAGSVGSRNSRAPPAQADAAAERASFAAGDHFLRESAHQDCCKAHREMDASAHLAVRSGGWRMPLPIALVLGGRSPAFHYGR